MAKDKKEEVKKEEKEPKEFVKQAILDARKDKK